MFRAMFPFDTKSDIGYAVALSYQFVNSFSFLSSIIFMSSTGMMVINNISLLIHVLKTKITNLGMDRKKLRRNDLFQKEMNEKINDIIKDHHIIMM